MKVRSQMQGGKNWILHTGSSETLIGWKSGKNNLCSSMGDRMEGALLWTHVNRAYKKKTVLITMQRP
jgi:hypothetical protein